MPSLSSLLNNSSDNKKLVRSSDGTLTENTPEEVQSLSNKAGLASPPITPLGTAMIGGNPDQAKMAGTKAQKTAALSLASQQPGQSLADAVRRGQGNERSQATGTEQAGMQKSQDLQALGGLGDRVNDFINAQRARLAQAQPVEVQTAQQFNGKDVTQLKPLLAQLRANPTDMNLQLQINQALGYDVNKQLSPDQINQLYESAVDSISKGGAGNVDNDLTVDDLISQGNFGYDKAEIAHLLNIPEDQVSTMNVGQLRNQLSQVQADEFNNTNQLEQKATSNELGGAERALARVGAREASRTGTRSSEADVQHLESQIANADEVTFGGQSYKVDDLLKDETISGIISDYMNSAPGSETRKQLEQSEPGLIQFIQKNQAVLQDAAQHLSQGAQQFTDVQSYNKSLVQNLPQNIANLVAPEAGSLQSGKIDINSKPLLAWAQSNPQGAQALQGVTDDDARALSQLSVDELNKLQIGQSGGKWAQYQQDKSRVEDLRNRMEHATTPDEIVNQLFDGKFTGNYNDLAQQYKDERSKYLLGLGSNYDQYKSLDTDNDGNIQDPGQLRQQLLLKYSSPYTLRDALTGNRPDTGIGNAPQKSSPERFDATDKKIYDRLGSAWSDGKLTVDELMNNTKDFSDSEIRTLEQRLEEAGRRNGGVGMETGAGGLRQRLEDRINKRTDNDKYTARAKVDEQKAVEQKQDADKQSALDKRNQMLRIQSWMQDPYGIRISDEDLAEYHRAYGNG